MDHHKSSLCDYAVYMLLFIGILYVLVLHPPGNSDLFLPLQIRQIPQHEPSKTLEYSKSISKDQLEEALAGASTDNKTLIIATVNKAYVEGDKPMLDLFLDGFWIGDGTRHLINHLLLVAVDQMSYERCKFLRLHCYKLETDVDFVGEKMYMSEDFIKMMWRRTRFLGDVLKRGYHFIFTDTDVLWLRNPIVNLSQPTEGIDLQISTDKFNGRPWSEGNPINTGFYMIRSNNKTVQLFDEWYARKDNFSSVENRMKEQDVLAMLIREGIFKKLGLKVRFLETLYFSGFCQDSRDVRVVKTVHANCCRSIKAKLADLTAVVHDWKRYKSYSANETSKLRFRWSKHKACVNSWN